MAHTPQHGSDQGSIFNDSGSEDDDNSDSKTGSENTSHTESQTSQKTQKSIWRSIICDEKLENALHEMGRLEQTKSTKAKRKKVLQIILEKEQAYQIDFESCDKKETSLPFIHFVLEHSSSTSLPITLFLLKLILKRDPTQICSVHNDKPLLHRAIQVEVDSQYGDFTGLTSEICKLVDSLQATIAISQANNLNENCLHLMVKHRTHDAKSIIASVDLQHAPKIFGQQRKSTTSNDENGNTPLHDALNFDKVAEHAIVCSESNGDLCNNCKNATTENEKFRYPEMFPDEIIVPLIKGCPDVLKQRNAAGQSPYAFHLDTRTRNVEELLKKSQKQVAWRSSKANKNSAAGQKLSNHSEKIDAPANVHDPAPVNSKTWKSNEKDKETPMVHMSYNLQPSDSIIKQLEGWIDESDWGYEDMLLCFFPENDDKNKAGQNRYSRPRSRFLRPGTRVSRKTCTSYNFLKFESRLALVSLSLRPDSSHVAGQTDLEREEIADRDADNIISVFEWLRVTKGVTKILKVVVKDNPNRYCSEETIERCLEYMDEIRFLDWNRPDMSASTLSKAKGLTELSLYSTGTNAVLHHWSDTKGLVTLPKLRMVYLKADKVIHNQERSEMRDGHSTTPALVPGKWGLESFARNKANIDNFKERLQEHGRVIEVVDDVTSMGGLTNTSTGQERAPGSAPVQEKHAGFETAVQFAKKLKKPSQPLNTISAERRVKVALLDDGVDPEHEDIGDHLACDGFPQSSLHSKDDPFYTSTYGHGSTMASIISAICPFVEIHVAKIDCHNQGYLQNPKFDVERAADAVEWAIANDMDIICMSWIFKVTNNVKADADRLKTAIDNDRSGTVVYCAARDNNGNDLDATAYYPADCKESRSIGAANSYNMPQRYVVTKKTDFVFPSENILPNPIDGHSDGGNSVATAVATGVAALVLHCLWEEKIRLDQAQRKPIMDTLFWNLIGSGTSNTKYVKLAELFACPNGETPTPRRLVDRVLLKLGLERSDVENTGLRVPPRFHGFDC